MTFGLIRKGAGFLAVSFIAAAAVAQTAGSQGAGQPAAQPTGPALNIPQDVNFVGTTPETNVVRATAIVNEEIITRTDVEQRLALLRGGQTDNVPAEQLARDRAQVLRLLIDETLQIQAARLSELSGSETGLIGYWKFNEGTGTTVADDSPAPHTLTLFGGVTWGTGGPLAP